MFSQSNRNCMVNLNVSFGHSIVPLSREALKRERGKTDDSFASLTAAHAPKLNTVRDLALGDVMAYDELKHENTPDVLKYRKHWVYFGDIQPQLFDGPCYKTLTPTATAHRTFYPGFVSECLARSKSNGAHDFVIINIAERFARSRETLKTFQSTLNSQLKLVLELLNTPVDGIVTKAHIRALRAFIHGSERQHFDDELGYDDRQQLKDGLTKRAHDTTQSSGWLGSDGWPLKRYDETRVCAGVVPKKIKAFGEFLHDTKVVAMTNRNNKLKYPVPLTTAAIFLSGNVSDMLDTDTTSNLLKIINHDLNCTGMIVRIVLGDAKMGSVGLSLQHIGVSVLCIVPETQTDLDQPGRRGNRMCSHQGMPTLPSAFGALRELPRSEWVVRLLLLTSGRSDDAKIRRLATLQKELREMHDEIGRAGGALQRAKGWIPRELPIDNAALDELVQSGKGRKNVVRVAEDLKMRYATNSDEGALDQLRHMLNMAASADGSAPYEFDKKLINTWIDSLKQKQRRNNARDAFESLTVFAIHAAWSARNGEVNDTQSLHVRIQRAVHNLLTDPFIRQKSQATVNEHFKKQQNNANKNAFGKDIHGGTRHVNHAIRLPMKSWSYYIIRNLRGNGSVVNASTRFVAKDDMIGMRVTRKGNDRTIYKIGAVRPDGKAALLRLNNTPTGEYVGKNEVYVRQGLQLNTAYGASQKTFEQLRTQLYQNWQNGKPWDKNKWALADDFMRSDKGRHVLQQLGINPNSSDSILRASFAASVQKIKDAQKFGRILSPSEQKLLRFVNGSNGNARTKTAPIVFDTPQPTLKTAPVRNTIFKGAARKSAHVRNTIFKGAARKSAHVRKTIFKGAARKTAYRNSPMNVT